MLRVTSQLVPIDELKLMLKNKNITTGRLEAIFDRSALDFMHSRLLSSCLASPRAEL